MPNVEIRVTTDTKDLVNGVKQTKQSMDELRKSTNKTSQEANKKFKRTNGLIEDIEQSIKDWERAQKKATSVKSIERYNRKIAEGRKNLEAYKKRGVPALKEVNKTAKSGLGVFNKLGIAVAGVFAVGQIKSFIEGSVEAFDRQQKAEASLLVALDGRRDIQQRLIQQAKELQEETLFADEETIQAQSQLGRLLGNSEEAIKKLTPLVQDLATQQGLNLRTAAELVAKSVGSSTNALSRYGIMIEGAVGSSERLESAVKALNDQVGGQSKAAAETGIGSLQQLQNQFVDFQESVGRLLTEGITPAVEVLSNALGRLDESVNDIRLTIEAFRELNVGDIFRALGNQTIAVLENSIIPFGGAIRDLLGDFGLLDAEQFKFRFELGQSGRSVDEMRDSVGLLIDSMFGFNTIIKTTQDELKKTTGAYDALKKEIGELQKQLANEVAANSKNAEATALLLDEKVRLLEQYDKEIEAIKLLIEAQKEYADGIPQIVSRPAEIIGRSINDVTEELSKLTNKFNEAKTDLERSQLAEEIAKLEAELAKLQKTGESLKPIKPKVEVDVDETEDNISEIVDAIGDIADAGLDVFRQITDERIKQSNELIRQLDKQLNEELRILEAQSKLAEQGKASSVTAETERVRQLQKLREEEERERAKAVQKQRIADALSQVSSLATAVAKLWAADANKGILALATVPLAISTMFALFSAAKTQAQSVTQLEKGGHGMVQGKRHSQGGEAFGDHVEVESGERWGVLNRRASMKYASVFPEMVEAMNKGQFSLNKELTLKNNALDHSVSLSDDLNETNDLLRLIAGKEFSDGKYTYVKKGIQTIRIKR